LGIIAAFIWGGWIMIVGIILLSAMALGGVYLYALEDGMRFQREQDEA
jgi:hypothetical protein